MIDNDVFYLLVAHILMPNKLNELTEIVTSNLKFAIEYNLNQNETVKYGHLICVRTPIPKVI